jgi:hypothetical protein
MRLLRSRENDAPARVGVVGDVHACDEWLARLLDHLREVERVDAIWCVGDIVNGPGDPDRCATLLVSAGAVTVRGNHDRRLVDGVSVIPDAHRPEDSPRPRTRSSRRCRRARTSCSPAACTRSCATGSATTT